MSRLSLLDKTKPAQGDAVAEPSGEASRPVTRGAFAMLSTQPLTWAVSLAAIALVPRYLGDDGLGRFAIAWTIGGYIGLAATLGLPNYVTRKVAMEPAKAATYAWGAVVVMTLMFIPLASAVLAALATFHPAAVDEWLVIVGMSETFVWSAQGILMASFVGQQRHVHYAWWAASASAFVTAVGLATLLAGGDVHMYAGAVFIATVAITAAQWALSGLGFTRASLVPGILRELVVGGLPFLWWNVALRIRDNADVVMTGLLIPAWRRGLAIGGIPHHRHYRVHPHGDHDAAPAGAEQAEGRRVRVPRRPPRQRNHSDALDGSGERHDLLIRPFDPRSPRMAGGTAAVRPRDPDLGLPAGADRGGHGARD